MSDFIKYEDTDGNTAVKVELKGGNVMHIISPKKQSDFIKVNCKETDDNYLSIFIFNKNNLYLQETFFTKSVAYYAIAPEIGKREIICEEYERLCKELGVDN